MTAVLTTAAGHRPHGYNAGPARSGTMDRLIEFISANPLLVAATLLMAIAVIVVEVQLRARALLEVSTAEVVRMSVAAAARRRGLGRRILSALCAEAKARGFRRVILETTQTWSEVIAFYQSFGFRITHYKDGDVYFELLLDK